MIYNADSNNAIKEILTKLLPGDTLNVSSGTYCFSEVLSINTSGEEGNLVTINANHSIFDFSLEAYKLNGVEVNGDYLSICNLHIIGAGYKGILVTGNHNVFNLIETSYNMDSGFQLLGGDNLIQNCDSHDNFDYRLGFNKNNLANFGFSSDGFSDKIHSSNPNTFIGCRSWSNSDDGFDFYNRYSPDGTTTIMKNCWAFCNGKSVFNMEKHPRYQYDLEWFEQFKEPYLLHFFQYNLPVSITKYPGFGDGCGFKLSGKHLRHNIELTNCIAYNNKFYGYSLNTGLGAVTLTNCEALNNIRAHYEFMQTAKLVQLTNCSALNDNIRTIFTEISNAIIIKDTPYTLKLLIATRTDTGDLPNLNVNDND